MSRSIVVAFSLFAAACGAPADGGSGGNSGRTTCGGDCGSPHDTGPSATDGGTTQQPNGIPSGGKIVFVTSAAYAGNVGGLEGGDELCNAAASAVGLPGTYVAWLATYNHDANERISGDGPWYLLDGKKAFNTASQLRTQPLVAIEIDENGASQANENAPFVWTGAATGGGSSAQGDCDGWTDGSSNAYGSVGQLDTTSRWTSASGTFSCDTPAHLYCFEQ